MSWVFWENCSHMNQSDAATLRDALHQRNTTITRELVALESAINGVTIPALLEPYRQKMMSFCHHFRGEAEANLNLLALNRDSLLEDIVSKTRVANHYLRLLSSRFASPILRGGKADHLCLKVISWMHETHPKTKSLPAVFANGGVGVVPHLVIAPIYFFPSLEQSGLLYQSLHFHEFG